MSVRGPTTRYVASKQMANSDYRSRTGADTRHLRWLVASGGMERGGINWVRPGGRVEQDVTVVYANTILLPYFVTSVTPVSACIRL